MLKRSEILPRQILKKKNFFFQMIWSEISTMRAVKFVTTSTIKHLCFIIATRVIYCKSVGLAEFTRTNLKNFRPILKFQVK